MTLADTIIYDKPGNLLRAIQSVAHLNYIDEYGYTPLIEAAIVNDVEKARLLLQHKADPNGRDLTGGSALHWAVENNNLELCQLLLDHQADPNSYNLAGQSVLVKPILRRQKQLKALLCQRGASIAFAVDFINTKLLGHLYELISAIDIVDPRGYFTEVEFEGFFLEFTMELVQHSIYNFQRNYAARSARHTFHRLGEIIQALSNGAKLLKYQQYLIDVEKHQKAIDALLSLDPLIVPISQEGHAITLIKCGNLLAICDRSQYEEKPKDIVIYYMNRTSRLTKDLLRDFIYKLQPLDIFHKILPVELGLQPIDVLPITPQLSGNCSWANVEACVPALFYMLELNSSAPQKKEQKQLAMWLFHRWREWEKDRILNFCIRDFAQVDPKRKASKASLLAAILFQSCPVDEAKSIERAMKIIPVLKTKGYEYNLENYLDIYWRQQKTAAGENLQKLLKEFEMRSL